MAPLFQCQIRGHCLYRTSQSETAVEELVVLEPVLTRIADPLLLVLLPRSRQIYMLIFGRNLAVGEGHWIHWVHWDHWDHCQEEDLHQEGGRSHVDEEDHRQEEEEEEEEEEGHHLEVALLLVAETATWCCYPWLSSGLVSWR